MTFEFVFGLLIIAALSWYTKYEECKQLQARIEKLNTEIDRLERRIDKME